MTTEKKRLRLTLRIIEAYVGSHDFRTGKADPYATLTFSKIIFFF
jgi:hypothetical protein